MLSFFFFFTFIKCYNKTIIRVNTNLSSIFTVSSSTNFVGGFRVVRGRGVVCVYVTMSHLKKVVKGKKYADLKRNGTHHFKVLLSLCHKIIMYYLKVKRSMSIKLVEVMITHQTSIHSRSTIESHRQNRVSLGSVLFVTLFPVSRLETRTLQYSL